MTNPKHTILAVCTALFATNTLSAQSFEVYRKQVWAEFDSYKAEQQREFKEYRDRVNAEFAEYMREAWAEHTAEPAIPVPDGVEPPKPVANEPDGKPTSDPIPFEKVVAIPRPTLPPQPIVPMPLPELDRPTTERFVFEYYGALCSVSLTDNHRFVLSRVDESAVADAWVQLSSENYTPVVAECVAWRDRLHLCDWGYVGFLEQMTKAFFSEQQNEARLMQMFILAQSGYKVRIAQANNELIVLFPSHDVIYEYAYLPVGDMKYYIADSEKRHKTLRLFDREFPNEQLFSLQIAEEPVLAVQMTEPRLFMIDGSHDVSVAVNRNMIDFYDGYPLSNAWDMYVRASLSQSAKNQLYPSLQQSISGKAIPDAANILLHFVQRGFEYQTDGEQFGGERALFADESLYYPYCDCEDRSILYSILVRDLLGLDVVLLHYPGHLATAVRFDDNVSGDYICLDSGKYTVCDPTYIGASIGCAMPQYKQVAAVVVKID